MYEQNLILSGLTKDEAHIYEMLVRNGRMRASDIARDAQISSRPLAYKILDDLEEKGLIEKHEKEKGITEFTASHPLKLKEFVLQKREQAEGASIAVEGILGKLISDFNLTSGKPGIRFFEGKAGMKAVLDDSLTAKEAIDTYVDIEAIEKYIPDINKEYSQQREKYGIKKRGIVLDTPFNRKHLSEYHTRVTDTKFIKLNRAPFHTVMQIYDKKISYLTLREENMIGAIIEDPHIYAMHKSLFEYLWTITRSPDTTAEQVGTIQAGPRFEEL
jgi:sugar-specific transcriptional regulator TrmB